MVSLVVCVLGSQAINALYVAPRQGAYKIVIFLYLPVRHNQIFTHLLTLPDQPLDDDRSIVLSRRTHRSVEDNATGVTELPATGKRVRAGVGVSRDGNLLLNVDDVVRARLEANIRKYWLREVEDRPEVVAAGARYR